MTDFDLSEFEHSRFVDANEIERAALCSRLATRLTRLLPTYPSFHAATSQLVDLLRSLGHDLWSFDESDELEIWCPDYAKGASGVQIEFFQAGVTVTWCETTPR
jgi:hypothetical protein